LTEGRAGKEESIFLQYRTKHTVEQDLSSSLTPIMLLKLLAKRSIIDVIVKSPFSKHHNHSLHLNTAGLLSEEKKALSSLQEAAAFLALPFCFNKII